jgi:hypothetical protein
MKYLLPLLLLLAGCGRDEPPAENRAEPEAGRAAPDSARPKAAAAAAERLTGLYEGGSGAQKNQLCMVEKGKDAQFGLIVWGGNLHSCSGAGQAVLAGERLSLRMTGDETCTIEAILKDGDLVLPATVPTGCAYYCGARASFAGARFARSGATEADAHKATDIAGDRLCD